MAFGEAPGTALGGLSPSHLETSQRKPALWKHLDLQVSTRHGGTHMQITQRCPRSASGDMTAARQRRWWSALHCHCMHIPP